jgi:hypothetical protein
VHLRVYYLSDRVDGTQIGQQVHHKARTPDAPHHTSCSAAAGGIDKPTSKSMETHALFARWQACSLTVQQRSVDVRIHKTHAVNPTYHMLRPADQNTRWLADISIVYPPELLVLHTTHLVWLHGKSNSPIVRSFIQGVQSNSKKKNYAGSLNHSPH